MITARPLTTDEHRAYTAAQVNALEHVPYFATALWHVTPVAAEGLGTFAVDRTWRLYLDPATLQQWGPIQSGAVLAHEVSHLLRDHADRADELGPNHDHETWNYATDAAINEDLCAANLPLPEGVITPETLGLTGGQIEEEYYHQLPRSQAPSTSNESNGQGCGSGAGDPRAGWELPENDASAPSVSPARQRMTRRQVAEAVSSAAASQPGTVPAGMARWARQELDPPVVDWRRQLRAAVRRAHTYVKGGQHDYTYARPGRRQVPGIVTPSMHAPEPMLATVIDTSGSMSSDALNSALSEIAGAVKAFRRTVSVISCDATPHVQTGVTRAEQVVLAGGGGTDMRVGIAAAQRLRPRPDIIAVLTDGYTPWPDPIPERLIVGLINPRQVDTPAWAHTVHIPPHKTV